MTNWIRFRDAEGRIGFGTLDQHAHRVLQHDGTMFDKPKPTNISFALEELTLLAPCQPSKVIALWNNYYALSQKLDKAPPQHPLFLIKPPMSVIGPGEAIRRPKSYQGKIAYEGELGIVIGKTVQQCDRSRKPRRRSSATRCVNDVTADRTAAGRSQFRAVVPLEGLRHVQLPRARRSSTRLRLAHVRTSSRRSKASSGRTIRSTT